MPRQCSPVSPSTKRIYRATWSSALVKARDARDAWGCLVAEAGNVNKQIKSIVFPTQLRQFLVGSDDRKVDFTILDGDIDGIHAVFEWDNVDGLAHYQVAARGAKGLKVDGIVVYNETVHLIPDCTIQLGENTFIFRTYALAEPTPYLGATNNVCQFRKLVGTGGYGSVSIADLRETRTPVAVKVIYVGIGKINRLRMLRRMRRMISREILSLSSLRHPNLLMFKGAIYQPVQCDIITEYMPGDDLHSYIEEMGKLPMKYARNISRQICDGGSFLHASGFIHRDLKLKNIIYDPKTERVKIIDMGLCLPRTEHENWKERQRRKTYLRHLAEMIKLATIDDRDGLTHVLGTSSYMAPEQADPDFEYNERVDSYSTGIIVYEMLTGYRAHRRTANNAKAIKARGSVWLTRVPGLVSSPTAVDFITKLGAEESFWRITLTLARQHSWLQETPSEAEEAEVTAFLQRSKGQRSGLRPCPSDDVSTSDAAENKTDAFHGTAEQVVFDSSGARTPTHRSKQESLL